MNFVPIPPDVWARMDRRGRERAKENARRYIAYRTSVEQQVGNDVLAQARLLQAVLPVEDPAVCARRRKDAMTAIYGDKP